nr:type ISP restriction/modification enzyme [Candidatus Sigynarchaeota archaeon]
MPRFKILEDCLFKMALKLLASQMASIAMKLREHIKFLHDHEALDGPVHELHQSFTDHLGNVGSIKEFADTCAQAIVHGLFSWRIASKGNPRSDNIEGAKAFLVQLFQGLGNSSIINRVISTIADADMFSLVKLLQDIDMNAVSQEFMQRGRAEDLIFHFYDIFLSEYDPTQKGDRGIFYTPDPVVKCIVTSIDDFLKTKFEIQDGLADRGKLKARNGQALYHRVMILDPATGTGIFLHHVIKAIYTSFSRQHASLDAGTLASAWQNYVTEDLLLRLFGFELLPAPYAIALLNLTLTLRATGYNLESGRKPGIFLTNALENTVHPSRPLDARFNGNATGASLASAIKNDFPISVIIGNPPYNVASQNVFEWIDSLVDDYFKEEVLQRPGSKRVTGRKSSRDDLVKFIRFAQWKIADRNKQGIVAYITSNSYLTGIAKRGMRAVLRQAFDEIWIIDLHGAQGRAELPERAKKAGIVVDENVFNITVGVAIAFFIKLPGKRPGKKCKVFYAEKFGTNAEKLDFLAQDIGTMHFIDVPDTPDHDLAPSTFDAGTGYSKYPYLCNIFHKAPLGSIQGVVTGADWFVSDISKDALVQRLKDFYAGKVQYGAESVDLNKARQEVPLETALASIIEWNWRGFDKRYICYRHGFMARDRYQVLQFLLPQQNNVSFIVHRQVFDEKIYSNAFITDTVFDNKTLEGSRGLHAYAFPLKISTSNTADSFDNPKPATQYNIRKAFKELLPYYV